MNITDSTLTVHENFLRVLHRSHPDPSTKLRTSYIRPLTRIPTFAKPSRHGYGASGGEYNPFYDGDGEGEGDEAGDDEYGFDEGEDAFSFGSGEASPVSPRRGEFPSSGGPSTSTLGTSSTRNASASGGAHTPTRKSSFAMVPSSTTGGAPAESISTTLAGNATASHIFSETSMRLDSALPYPEWRREVVTRAREISRGPKFPFPMPCGHSLLDSKMEIRQVDVGECMKLGSVVDESVYGQYGLHLSGAGLGSGSGPGMGTITLTTHSLAKAATLAEYFKHIATGQITLSDLPRVSLADMRPAPYQHSSHPYMTEGPEGLRCPEEEDAVSENEWDNWKADIERQKPRRRRFGGPYSGVAGGPGVERNSNWVWGDDEEVEEGEVKRYHPGQGAYTSHHSISAASSMPTPGSMPLPGRRPSPIHILPGGAGKDKDKERGRGDLLPNLFDQGGYTNLARSKPRSRSRSSSTPATSPISSPLPLGLGAKPSMGQIQPLGSASPKGSPEGSGPGGPSPGGSGIKIRDRAKTLAVSPTSPTSPWHLQPGPIKKDNGLTMTTMGSPRVIPASPMSAEGLPPSSTASSSATNSNNRANTGYYSPPNSSHGPPSQSQILSTPSASKGLGKTTTKWVGKLSRPRSSNQVSSNTPFGDREQESGVLSAASSIGSSNSNPNAFTSPIIGGLGGLDHHGVGTSLSERERERERGKTKDLWGIPKQSSTERMIAKEKERKEKDREREKEKEKEREGKAKRSFSVRDGAGKALKKGKEKFVKGFDDALDFVDGK
jgi:hypothetical protein